MTRRWLFMIALWSLASFASAQAPSGGTQTKDEASAHFQQGVELFREGAYRAALVELQRAHEIAPDHRVLYNIGQTQLQLGEYVEAIRAFEAYVVQGGNQIDATRREEVEGQLTQLRKRVATLAISVNVAGASVFVDGAEVGQAPLPRTIPVSVGRHRVLAQSADRQTASVVVDVAGGDLKEISLALVEPVPAGAAGEPAQQTAQAEPAGLTTLDKWGVGLLSSGVAVGLAAGTTGFMAMDARDNYGDELKKVPGTAKDIEAAHDDLTRFSLLTDVLAAGAIALGVTGVVLLLLDSRSERSGKKQDEPSLKVGLTPRGLVAGGRF